MRKTTPFPSECPNLHYDDQDDFQTSHHKLRADLKIALKLANANIKRLDNKYKRHETWGEFFKRWARGLKYLYKGWA